MEAASATPERIENCPSTPENEVNAENSSIEEARLVQLKIDKGICVICYSSIKNGLKRCFPENCLHIFHFDCLQRWSQQKNQCPLCKKVFNEIIHNIKSKTEFDRHTVTVLRQEESNSPIDLRDFTISAFPTMLPLNVPLNSVFHHVNFLANHSPRRRFTYRTRFEATLEQNERIQELFGTRIDNDYARLTPAEWRQYIYDRNLFALPLPNAAGRYRECSAEFYRENPAQTHRLIPWLNRELVVLMTPGQTTYIPQILEDMREMLCHHDIQSRPIRKYFQRYLHLRTDHFIHEFYNFAISPFDIVGYDRQVDYNPRTASAAATATATVEISSNDSSSDGEVQVVDLDPVVNENASNSNSVITNTTSVVLETSGSVEENCVITDMHATQTSQIEQAVDPYVVETSSESECEFVLALKPPHLRTPEMLSLDSASDSDVIYIPNEPAVVTRVDSSTTDSEDNKPLAETKKQLKSEIDEVKPDIKIKEDIAMRQQQQQQQDDQNLILAAMEADFNFGASTSQNSQDPSANVRKIYFAPKRRRLATKSVFQSSSSTSSSSSGSSSDSSSCSDLEGTPKSKRRRKMSAKKLKRIRITSATVNNPKPLSQLQSSEEAAHNSDASATAAATAANAATVAMPRVKSVIIKKTDNQHYIQQTLSKSSSSSSSSSN